MKILSDYVLELMCSYIFVLEVSQTERRPTEMYNIAVCLLSVPRQDKGPRLDGAQERLPSRLPRPRISRRGPRVPIHY